MEDLKEKIFQFGIYGQKLTNLNEKEKEMVLKEKWIELLTENDVMELKKNFSPIRINISNSEMCKKHSMNDLYVRMDIIAWKGYLEAYQKFKFIKPKYYELLDYLIRHNKYVTKAEIQKELKIKPIDLFYMVKTLVGKGFVEKESIVDSRKIETYKLRIPRDEKGFIDRLGLKKTEENEQEVEELNNYEETLENIDYNINIGIAYNLNRYFLDFPTGVTVKKFITKAGITDECAYKFLKRVHCSYPELIVKKEEFIGRSRRNRYILAGNENLDSKEGALSLSDRVDAMKRIIARKPIFAFGRGFSEELRKETGWKYEFCKRTLLKTARAAGLNIYSIKTPNGQEMSFVTANNISKEYLKNTIFKINDREELSGLRRRLYETFVDVPEYNIIDNGYEASEFKRIIMLYEYLKNNYQNLEFALDWQVISKMPLSLVLSIIPFNRFDFRVKIIKIFQLSSTIQGVKGKYSEVSTLDDITVEDVMNNLMCDSYLLVLRMKIVPKNFVKLIKSLHRFGFIEAEISNEKIIIKNINNMPEEVSCDEFKPVDTHYISLEKRKALAEYLLQFSEEHVYDKAYGYIQSNFTDEEKKYLLFKLKRTKVFTKLQQEKNFVEPLESKISELYIHFKESIIIKGYLSTPDYSKYSVLEAREALKLLSESRVISNYKNVDNLAAVTPGEKFINRMKRQYDMLHFCGYEEMKGTGYFSLYFDQVYYLLASSGSMEFYSILDKLKTMAGFEFELFLKNYNHVFTVVDVCGENIVSLKLILDPFSNL